VEVKFEARNLLDTRYREYQEAGENRIYFNRYRVGRTFNIGASLKL
jgi:outer membrane receptor protein involved in Fe transport